MNKQGYRKPEPEMLMLLMLAVNGEMNQADLTAVYEESPLTELMNAGLVGQWGGGRTFALTARGKAYVEMICRVPLPEKKEVWIDPRDGEQYGWMSFSRNTAKSRNWRWPLHACKSKLKLFIAGLRKVSAQLWIEQVHTANGSQQSVNVVN
jgi:hypothetical protein